MTRRRSLPWIYRWSRPLIGSIAVIGALLTGYLTVIKLTGGEVVCTGDAAQASAGCNDVLNSAYASVFGLPLPLFGCLAYLSMAIFALAPLVVNPEASKSLRSTLEDWSWLGLLAGATAMAVFSGFLMYILAFKLQTVCLYCIGSALFSLGLFILTIMGRDWEDLGQMLFTAIIVGVVTLIAALGVYASVLNPVADSGVIPQPTTSPQPPLGWKVTTTSGEAEIALAEHLTAIGAKKYGAYWCPHCYDQKQLFGKEAFSKVDYVECIPDGKNPRTQLCQEAGIQSFPTWEINGKQYPGTQTLQELAQLSDYQGPTNFKYSLPGR